MSVLNQSGEEQVECPLCMEPLEVDDLHFYPCTCGYQICRFCWNRIREGENGLCPACRKAYPENPADFTPLSQEQVAAIKTEKKAREQKRRNKTLESRRALANVRVVQNNLVFVVGLPVRLADPEILKRQEYFGKYGKIHKVVINQSTTYAGSQGPSASAYVTYVSCADALRAIQGVNNVTLDGRVLKGSLGTTKYCANFMKNQPCPKPDCMYLHELGDPKASFTKEEMHAGLHQVYERKLHNQLLASHKADDKNHYTAGNSSTNAEKCSSKDGNQSNFIPTTVVTSSNVNVVNSNASGNSNGNGSGNKEAWPSLGSSPPSDSPARKQHSPKPHNTVKSQENGTSESSSPTQLQTQAQTKNRDTNTDKNKNKEASTNGQTNKKSKSDKSKQKTGNSISNDISEPETNDTKLEHTNNVNNISNSSQKPHSVFDNDNQQNFLSNELDELESDRYSLLENHDLLDNSDHSLLEDDTHNLLKDTNNDVLMMHREMLSGLVDNNHLLQQVKSPLMNGYGLLDRDIGYLGNERQISQINPGLMDQKELMLRERSQSEMLMRQNDMLARHNAMIEPKHYMTSSSIGLDSTSELLGVNFYPNSSVGYSGMRMDVGSMSSMGGGYTMNQPIHQNTLDNGYDLPPHTTNNGRYVSENMDKFFTDFYKAQQMRQSRGYPDPRHYPQNMLSAERLEMEHKQRLNNLRASEGSGRAAGDGDDDLDFDPFKETQKAFAELMENEMQNTVPSGDNMDRVRRSRLVPPGFNHMNTFGLPGAPRQQQHTQQGYSNVGSSAMFSDWTQMDPAIMSTSVQSAKQPHGALTHQQQEVFARFNHLAVQPNTLKSGWGASKLWQSAYVPLPPGFAPPKSQPHPAECIDAK